MNLAILYQNGLGVPKDLKLAYKWLALAKRGGDQEAAGRADPGQGFARHRRAGSHRCRDRGLARRAPLIPAANETAAAAPVDLSQ